MNDGQALFKTDLPRWRCHKIVEAAKIRAVTPETLELEPGLGYITISITAAWHAKHAPQPGGYYVRYEDGYASFSPAEAFEQGYTKLASDPAIDDIRKDLGLRTTPPRPMSVQEQLNNWFTYHPPLEGQAQVYEQLRDAGKTMAEVVVKLCPESADRTVALRTIRDAVFWANASIACGGK